MNSVANGSMRKSYVLSSQCWNSLGNWGQSPIFWCVTVGNYFIVLEYIITWSTCDKINVGDLFLSSL